MEDKRKCKTQEEYKKLTYLITCAGYWPNGALDGELCEKCQFYIGRKDNRRKTIVRYNKRK